MVDLPVFCLSLKAQPTVERAPLWLNSMLPTAPVITGHTSLTPHLSITFPLSTHLPFYPSVPISREASPINLFKQPSEHPIHSNVVCEGEPVDEARMPVPVQCPSQPAPHHFSPPLPAHVQRYKGCFLLCQIEVNALYNHLTIQMTAVINLAASGDFHFSNCNLLFPSSLMFFLQCLRWLPPPHTLFILLPFHLLLCHFPTFSPLPVAPFLTSLSTLVTYFLSGCPEEDREKVTTLFSVAILLVLVLLKGDGNFN